MKTLGFITLSLLIGIPNALFYSFVFKSYWLWFIVPCGLPILTYKQCIGLVLFIFFLKFKNEKGESGTYEEKLKKWSVEVISIWIFLILALISGYIWNYFLNK